MPLFQGDVQGSLFAIMLFPDDWEKAHAWHARFIAGGALTAYLKAGHDFSDRWEDYLIGVSNGVALDGEERLRWAGGRLVGETVKALWALICDRDERAGWSRAIEITSEAAQAHRQNGSVNHIRSQLRRFSSVLHLWGAWMMCDTLLPADELIAMSGALLGELRRWDEARRVTFKHEASYLLAEEVGPWRGWQDPGARLPRLTQSRGPQSNL